MAVRKRLTKPQPLKSKPLTIDQKDFSNLSMMKALDAVAKGKIGVKRAALEFNVACQFYS